MEAPARCNRAATQTKGVRFTLVFNDRFQVFAGGDCFVLVQPGGLLGQQKVSLLATWIVRLTGEMTQGSSPVAASTVCQATHNVGCTAAGAGGQFHDLRTTVRTFFPPSQKQTWWIARHVFVSSLVETGESALQSAGKDVVASREQGEAIGAWTGAHGQIHQVDQVLGGVLSVGKEVCGQIV